LMDAPVSDHAYAAGRFHLSRGLLFNIHDGTVLPEVLPARNGAALIAGVLDKVTVPLPKLVIRQLHALLTLCALAEHPVR